MEKETVANGIYVDRGPFRGTCFSAIKATFLWSSDQEVTSLLACSTLEPTRCEFEALYPPLGAWHRCAGLLLKPWSAVVVFQVVFLLGETVALSCLKKAAWKAGYMVLWRPSLSFSGHLPESCDVLDVMHLMSQLLQDLNASLTSSQL